MKSRYFSTAVPGERHRRRQFAMSNAEKQRRSSDALGGKAARACDSCSRRRARWYCIADDAFLCEVCDSSVHSANPLARRHHRLRLKATTNTSSSLSAADASPTWHHGFKRKIRTPRSHVHHTKPKPAAHPAAEKSDPLVPDLEGSGEDTNAEEEQQLLYRVPIFDQALSEFCSPPPFEQTDASIEEEVKAGAQIQDFSHISQFRPSEMDIEEFAADVESLLGRGLDDGTFSIEDLGLVDSREGNTDIGRVIKTEVDGNGVGGIAGTVDCVVDMETLDIDFDCGWAPLEEGEERKEDEALYAADGYSAKERMSLRLDYDAVIAEWSGRSCSPWTDGERPQLNPDDCWPNDMGMQSGEVVGPEGQAAGDGGREARVTRYREKRRTRLFAKKIRYEVRKLNAEKRPRMKGRFVKRASFL